MLFYAKNTRFHPESFFHLLQSLFSRDDIESSRSWERGITRILSESQHLAVSDVTLEGCF